jgi:hypothetical protein
LVIQINKGEKTKSVGIVKINLAEYIEDEIKGGLNKVRQKLNFEKCPDKAANIQFTIFTSLISSAVSGDGISCMMSDM